MQLLDVAAKHGVSRLRERLTSKVHALSLSTHDTLAFERVHSPDCDPRQRVIFVVSLSLSPAIDVPISKDFPAGETEWKDRRSLGAWVRIWVIAVPDFQSHNSEAGPMMTLRYVGLDVHKDSISVAVADVGDAAAQVLERLPFDEARVLKLLRTLGPLGSLKVCYEAGPTGYGLQGS
ncbi:MAG: hypothetical protein R3C01_02495 [Planctomycetaceae bacterium]